jgi:hypothetical protein
MELAFIAVDRSVQARLTQTGFVVHPQEIGIETRARCVRIPVEVSRVILLYCCLFLRSLALLRVVF